MQKSLPGKMTTVSLISVDKDRASQKGRTRKAPSSLSTHQAKHSPRESWKKYLISKGNISEILFTSTSKYIKDLV